MKFRIINSIILGLLVTAVVAVLLTLAQVGPLVPAGIAGLMASTLGYTHDAFVERRRSYEISGLAPFVISEARVVLLSTGSLFEVIKHIAESGFRWVSNDFRKLRLKIIQGEDPDKVLQGYVIACDSQTLREGLAQLLAQREARNTDLHPTEIHATTRFVEEAEKLSPKLAVAMAWCFFLPIVLTVLLTITAKLNEILALVALLVYLIFSIILREFLTRKEAHLIY